VIQSDILDELSLQIIEGKIGEGDSVTVDVKDTQISFRKKGATNAK